MDLIESPSGSWCSSAIYNYIDQATSAIDISSTLALITCYNSSYACNAYMYVKYMFKVVPWLHSTKVICKQCGERATAPRITSQHVLWLGTLHGWPHRDLASIYVAHLICTVHTTQTLSRYLGRSQARPRVLPILPEEAGNNLAMPYKRGVLVFVFLLSAYSVYHVASSHAELGALHKMKRSVVSNLRH